MKAQLENGRIVIELDEDDDDEIRLEIVIKRKETPPIILEPVRREPRKYIFDDVYKQTKKRWRHKVYVSTR